jgi:LysR family glycine cleavage system transcriptional activator
MKIDWANLPPLSALRAFQAVSDAGGYSAAARALNVTHAAVAQQVRGLEERLGHALVTRDGRGMALTAEGLQLAAALSEGFGAIQRGLEALSSGEDAVRVTLTASFASQWLMPRLRDFWDRFPDIALSLHPDPRPVDLRREGIDVAIRYGGGQWPGLKSEYLAPARLAVAAAPELLPAGRVPSMQDLAALDWIILRNWPEQDNYIASLGFDPRALSRTEFPNEELSIGAAREGLGVIVESLALLQGEIDAGRLVLLDDSETHLPAYFIVTTPEPKRRTVRQFLSWLREAA